MPIATKTSPYHQPRQHDRAHVESTPAGSSLPVIVVGAGPSGMATALGLGARGIKVTVLEAGTAASYGSRATCYSRHTQEIADRLGYGDLLASRAVGWVGGRSFYRDREVLHFTMPHEPHSFRPPMVNIGQSEYEEMQLHAVARNPNVTILWGVAVTGVAPDASGVTLTVDTVDGERTLRADRVVAGDGARSKVRNALGLHMSGTAYEGRYVIADIHWKSPLPTQRMVWFDPPSNPGSTVIMHKQPDDIWRIDYQLSPKDDTTEETTREAVIARVTKHLAWLENNGTITKEPWTLEWQGYYKALSVALPEFVHGRVIFTGDAAHLVPIFGVRGLNSGMEDGDVLAWMLAAVINGDADESLLNAYSIERRDAWEQNIGSANKSTLVMTPSSEGYRMTRDALLQVSAVMPEFSHLIDPRQSTATHARRSPLAIKLDTPGLISGDPLEDRRITLDGRDTSLHTARGTAFGVYAVGPIDGSTVAGVAERLQRALPHQSVHTLVLNPGNDGGAAAAWGLAPGQFLIVRPDGIILTRGDQAALGDIEGALSAARKVPGSPAPASPASRGTTPDPVRLTDAQKAREQVWLELSAALDANSAGANSSTGAGADREAFLTRLALVLGADVGPERLADVLAKLSIVQ
ncbi:3-(3-hydroxy-phenyl)propionate/3-hydroxycinnamic acid hydroxylase [Vanrija pseudolonga]|uniref:3-(3-hydroxy-phenyl)propionate/3-hydroxycinnamic acid hydroxylase n=1 Tax=Vanrija pseudolonga TaxID=143232 RepID=A0AAF1BPD9_9TREE|nr:3-(3-hydroxy-phenyl)propionate/3-hydroxycinnamic acid hydroxylase [Vanrija pseudolonga]